MKNKLLKLLLTTAVTLVCCILITAIMFDIYFIIFALVCMLIFIAIYLIFEIVQQVIDIITCRKKKKMKTNETKIRLQVKFVAKGLPSLNWSTIFVSKNLIHCITRAINCAKEHNCLIDEMNVLTTEE